MFGKKKEKTNEQAKTGKKPGRLKWIIGIAAVGVLAFFVVKNVMGKGNAAVTVETAKAEKSSIEEVISISGTVESAEKKDYYADISVRIKSVPFKAGDRVKAGDMIASYDMEELEISKQTALLNLQQADGNYDDSISKTGKAMSKKAVADRNLPGVQAQLDAKQAQIDAINEQINQKRLRMAQVGTQLQQAMHDINQNGQYDGLTDQNYMETQDSDGNEMYLAMQNAIAENQLAQSNDPEIMAWNRQIQDLNEEISKLTEKKTELKTDQTAGENAELTEGGKSALEAQRQLVQLTNEKTLKDIEAAGDGLRSDFNGVLTELSATDGATVPAGTKLFSIANTDKVKVTMSISKNDLMKVKTGQAVDITINGRKYEGEVSWISGTATRNASNVPVVAAEVTVKNPDENIVLGVEASMKIHAAKADNVVVLPYEYVNTDTHGDFVYVVENGLLTRRDVSTGITTGTDAEITEGLSEGEEIVISDTTNLTEGTAVTAMAAAAAEQ